MSSSTKEVAPSSNKAPEAPPLPIFKPAENNFRIEDPLSAPPGTYFLYGTLQDPTMLMEILDLLSPPVLRPAYVVGYTRRLWGQYPALVDGPTGAVVKGRAFEVPTTEAAEKLAYYETSNYTTAPCLVHLADGKSSTSIYGYTFVFAGREDGLADGDFDLNLWLKSMGRAPAGA